MWHILDSVWVLIPITAIVSIFVIPPFMALRHKERMAEIAARAGMSSEDAAAFTRSLGKLEERVRTLEKILDAEAPDWRKRHTLEEA